MPSELTFLHVYELFNHALYYGDNNAVEQCVCWHNLPFFISKAKDPGSDPNANMQTGPIPCQNLSRIQCSIIQNRKSNKSVWKAGISTDFVL